MPDLKHAELIDGIVHTASPVSIAHGDFHVMAGAWMGNYAARTPGCFPGAESTWLMRDDSAPQPDLALRVFPSHGGQSREEGNLHAGAPELIAEVTASTRALDLGPKAKLYERSGVQEYLTVLVKEERVIWRELRKGRYRKLLSDPDGIYRSRVFPGLWLDEPAFWRRDLSAVFAAVDHGTQSAGHAKFVALLAERYASLRSAL